MTTHRESWANNTQTLCVIHQRLAAGSLIVAYEWKWKLSRRRDFSWLRSWIEFDPLATNTNLFAVGRLLHQGLELLIYSTDELVRTKSCETMTRKVSFGTFLPATRCSQGAVLLQPRLFGHSGHLAGITCTRYAAIRVLIDGWWIFRVVIRLYMGEVAYNKMMAAITMQLYSNFELF